MPSSSISSSERVAPAATYSAAPAATRARSRRGARPFFVRALVLLVIAAMPIAFSAWVDPARLVSSRSAEDAIAHALASGKNVTDFANYDDRAIERSLAALRPRAEVLVLGSSRLQPLTASAVGGASFVNAAMQGGTLDDMIAVYGLYDVDGRRPSRVVIGVDPWTQSARLPAGWGALVNERAAVMRRMGYSVSPLRDRVSIMTTSFKRVAAPEYFRLSLFSFRRYGAAGIVWRVSDSAQNREKTKLPDGTVVWSDVPADNAIPLAARYASEGLFADSRFAKLDARERGREDLLERFVRYLSSEGVKVTVVLVPYPPEVFSTFGRLPGRSVVSVEADLRAMSRRLGAEVIGSYDPRPFGFGARDFYDESHLRAGALGDVVAGRRGP